MRSSEIITQTTGSDEQGRGYVVDVLRKPRAEEVTRHEFYMSTPGNEETYQAPPTDGRYADYEPIKKPAKKEEKSTALVPQDFRPAPNDEDVRRVGRMRMDAENVSQRNFQDHLKREAQTTKMTTGTRVIRIAIATLVIGGLALVGVPSVKKHNHKAPSNLPARGK